SASNGSRMGQVPWNRTLAAPPVAAAAAAPLAERAGRTAADGLAIKSAFAPNAHSLRNRCRRSAAADRMCQWRLRRSPPDVRQRGYARLAGARGLGSARLQLRIDR